ncbi:integrase catalytic domain-containing protein [Trichonephila clavipes]|nr:integrase catalytic domain-containing protein [Trichonephila clavipes]
MDALKLRRTPLRTAFTKAVNHLQEIIENDPVDKNAVETAFEMLDAKSVKLKKIDEDILELKIDTNCTQEAYNIEFEAIEGYTEKMIAWQVRVKNKMKTDALGQKDNHSLVISSSSSLRLPKIQFQQFSGELTDWLRFHNQFKRIHEDESIGDGDKFQYLIKATTPKSRVRDIVESFPATPENYRKAFEYLRMRFGQEDFLIQVYIEAQLRALGSLGVTKEKYAAMLFPLVESCLPAEILRAWERYVGYSSDESGLETESESIENSTTASSCSSNVLANQACTSEVLLQTLVVMLKNGNHKSLVRDLTDTGSQKSYILKSTAENLGFKYEGEEEFAGKLLTGTLFDLKSGTLEIKTKLGWTLMGKTYRNETKFDKNHFMNVTSMFVNDMCISDLWKLDSLGITDPVETKTKLEIQKETLNHFQKTISVDISGRYEVALPWVLDNKLLSSNRKLAENRLESTKRKLIAKELESQPDNFEIMVLGLIWNLKDDCLSCNINCQKNEGKAITKISLLSIANHIFDPIGFTAPVTLKLKLILQEVWKLKLKWDENLPKDILNQVKKWLEQLHILAGAKDFRLKSGSEVVPSSLLKDRVSNSKIFQVVGVDLADPLHLKDRRKGWVVLFTCAVFRAVHFELITSLSTAAFLQSLRRFISRRGRPTIIYSDNGTNFVGSNSALNSIDWDVVMSKANIQKIKWKFNPPSASWWGGFWERMIQMIKKFLRKMLGRASLYYEELNTVLCECEHVINSRPLTYISEDVNNLSPLTPAMFLQEIETSDVTDKYCLDHQEINKRIRHVQPIRKQLRKRFRIEYLGQLREQTQHHRKLRPLTVGEVVVVENSLKNRNLWSLARVIQLIPGKDGHVRVAGVRTARTIY